ncbi:MAG: hypothetical protein ACYCWE_01990 [Eubacteriales bacterium]
MDNIGGRGRGRDTDPRGTMNRYGNGWRINNALVEEVSAGAGQTGYLIISYAVRGRDRDRDWDRRPGRGLGLGLGLGLGQGQGPGQGRGPDWDRDDITNIELLRLNVNRNTIIINRNGRNINLRRIRPGMYIDAEFSYAWTRSIPPQAAAYRIRVQSRLQEPEETPPGPPVARDQVVRVDLRNSILITGDRFDINRQMRYIVTDQTQILDRRGRRIPLRSLSPGQWVEITYAEISITIFPRQTTAFRIQLL